jgi:hypothetical protein
VHLGQPPFPGGSGLNVPGTGTIYRVKLRLGASTGPMQLVVLRTLFDPHDIVNNVCCVAQARSSVFTPVVNGITTLNVTLPVGEDDSPTASLDYLDQVGLSILKDKVTIPLINKTSLPIQDQPVDDYNEPAMTLGESQKAADPAGSVLDMQALWYPPGQSPATMTLPARPVKITGTNAVIPMGCTLAPCAGSLTIQNLPPAKTAGRPGRGGKRAQARHLRERALQADRGDAQVGARCADQRRTHPGQAPHQQEGVHHRNADQCEAGEDTEPLAHAAILSLARDAARRWVDAK